MREIQLISERKLQKFQFTDLHWKKRIKFVLRISEREGRCRSYVFVLRTGGRIEGKKEAGNSGREEVVLF